MSEDETIPKKKKKKTFWLLFFLNEPFSLGISVDLYDLEHLEGCRGQCWTHTSLLCNLWYLLFLSLSHYFSPRRLNPHPSARIKWRSGFGVVFYEWLEYQPVRFFCPLLSWPFTNVSEVSKMSIKVLIGNKLFETNAFSSRGWAVSQIEVPDVGIIEIIFRLLRF